MNKQVKGLNELNAKLRKMKGLKQNTSALMAGGYVIEAGGKRRAPVETGFLRDSGWTKKVGDAVHIIFSALYAVYQEFGTRFMKANPFIRPTIDEDETQIIDAIANQLQADLNNLTQGG